MSLYNFVLSLGNEHKKVAELVVDKCLVSSNTKILDVGAGSGLLGKYLYEHSKYISLLEPSKNMLLRSDLNFKEFNTTIQDSKSIKEKFDCVVCYDSLHHFSNGYEEKEKQLEIAIKNMYDLCIEGGKIIIIEPNYLKLRTKWLIFVENYIFRVGSYFSRNLEDFFSNYNYSFFNWKKYSVIIIEKGVLK